MRWCPVTRIDWWITFWTGRYRVDENREPAERDVRSAGSVVLSQEPNGRVPGGIWYPLLPTEALPQSARKALMALVSI